VLALALVLQTAVGPPATPRFDAATFDPLVQAGITGGAYPGAALVVGLASGLALFLATRVFVAIASRWGPFARHVEQAYRAAADEPIGAVLALSLLISAAEEVFYRGLVQRTLGETALRARGGALGALLAYALANLPSRSLPIVAGAVVGGAAWGALAWWSGGLAAPLASHILWTGLMLVLPPGGGREVRR